MDNRAILQQVLDAFENNDEQRLLELMTDDFEWNMVGDQVIQGKEKVREMFAGMEQVEMTLLSTDHIVLEGNTAVCDGRIKMGKAQSDAEEQFYCDIYEFSDGLLNKMTSYIIKQH